MWRGMIGILIAMPLLGVAAAAETAEEAPQPKCRKAEINPITGHVLCIDPLGAPVEPPPGEAKPPCKRGEKSVELRAPAARRSLKACEDWDCGSARAGFGRFRPPFTWR